MPINPQTANLNPAALIAAAQHRSRFVPTLNGFVVVQFPGETMRCPVKKVIDDNTVLVHIDSPPVSRMHTFRFDEIVGVRRRVLNTREFWEAQTERDFLAEQQKLHAAAHSSRRRPVAAPPPPPPVPKPEPEKAKPKKAKVAKSKPVKAKPKRKAG